MSQWESVQLFTTPPPAIAVNQVVWKRYGTLDDPWRIALFKATGEAARDLRAKAAQLAAYAVTIPWHRLWSLLRLVPDRHNALLASGQLMGIANRLPARNHDDVKQNMRANRFIHELLRMATKWPAIRAECALYTSVVTEKGFSPPQAAGF